MHAISLSWSAYLGGMIVIVVIYFLVVWFRYYRKFQTTSKSPVRHQPRQANYQTSLFPEMLRPVPQDQPVVETDLTVIVTHFQQELSALVAQLGALKTEKKDLLEIIRKLIQKYKVLKDSEYREAIGHLIIMEVDTHCAVQVSSDELVGLWL